MDNDKFGDCVSVNSHLKTSGVDTVKELCVSHVGTWSVEVEDSIPEPDVVPNFAEALMTDAVWS
jgi:hypothetical protein